MAYIKVNHKELERAANSIESYISKHKSKMNDIENIVQGLASDWQGEDYREVKDQWYEMEGKNSTSDKMLQALQNYADFLRDASNAYKRAQSDAINRANKLPRW